MNRPSCPLENGLARVVFLAVACLAFAALLPSHARAESTLKDLSAWIARDHDNVARMHREVGRADSAPGFAVALNAAVDRQHQHNLDLIALLRRHPELRDLPELGLTQSNSLAWLKAHRDAPARRARLPAPIIDAVRRMSADTQAAFARNDDAFLAATRKFHKDPQAQAALQRFVRYIVDDQRLLIREYR